MYLAKETLVPPRMPSFPHHTESVNVDGAKSLSTMVTANARRTPRRNVRPAEARFQAVVPPEDRGRDTTHARVAEAATRRLLLIPRGRLVRLRRRPFRVNYVYFSLPETIKNVAEQQ